MPQISVAKALKLKNRLAGRLAKVQSDIQTYNSVLEEQANKVDVKNLISQLDQLREILIGLKTKIILSNQEIQETLIRLGETKARMTFLEVIHVRDGAERHGYQNTEVVYVATLKKADIDAERKKLEAEIDAMQDKIDEFNHTKKIEIPQQYLDMAS
jgi:hypothetical protein